MASSGWQIEQTWFTYSSNIRLIGNIYIDSISHSGSSLRIRGTIAGGARGSNNYRFYYLDYTSYAQPEGGSKIALGSKGRTWKVGDSDVHVDFDVTLSNVAATTTSRSFYVNFYGPNTNSVVATLSWTLYFDASGSAPSGGSIVYNSSTWNSVTSTSAVSSWGGMSGTLESIVVTGSTNGAADNVTSSNWYNGYGRINSRTTTSSMSAEYTITDTSYYAKMDNPISLKGLTHYKLAYWNWNAVGHTDGLDNTLRYLPPAPSTMTVTDPGGEGTKNFPVTFKGDVDKNHTTYDTASLTRTVRYKVNDAAEWTYVAEDEVALIGAETTFTVRVPGSQSAVIEGWQTYHGMQSDVKTLNLYNGNAPSRVYGPVDGESKLATKVYGSVNGQSKEIVKLYGSVEGQSKAILG